jgi:hypothetical protein
VTRAGEIAEAIETIIELQAKPGKRDDLVRIMDRVIVTMRDVPRFLAIMRHKVLSDPDRRVEIAGWESPEARQMLDEHTTGTPRRTTDPLARFHTTHKLTLMARC